MMTTYDPQPSWSLKPEVIKISIFTLMTDRGQFNENRKDWDNLMSSDPMWAVLSDNDKKGKRWKEDEFYATGVRRIQRLMEELSPYRGESKEKALDFGCGIGRLTFPLSAHYTEVIGIDISEVAIGMARQRREGANISFQVNRTDSLEQIEDNEMDLVLSLITLQHMRPRFSEHMIMEFIRILKPGGLVYFQVTDRLLLRDLHSWIETLMPMAWYKKLYQWLYPSKDMGFMEMHGLRKRTVVRILGRSGMELLKVREDHSAGPRWKSYTYIARKKHP